MECLVTENMDLFDITMPYIYEYIWNLIHAMPELHLFGIDGIAIIHMYAWYHASV